MSAVLSLFPNVSTTKDKVELWIVISLLSDEQNRLRQEVQEWQDLVYEGFRISTHRSRSEFEPSWFYPLFFGHGSYSSQVRSFDYGQALAAMILTPYKIWRMLDQIRDRWSLLELMDDQILDLKKQLYELQLFKRMPDTYLFLLQFWVCVYQQVCETFRFERKAKWFPNRKRIPCSTMPWMIQPSLVVLWGVCWMFYGLSPPSSSRKPTLYSKDGS